MKLTKDIRIVANAYVLNSYDRIADHQVMIGVYPTRELAEQAKADRDETYHGTINTITDTVLNDADKLDLRISR